MTPTILLFSFLTSTLIGFGVGVFWIRRESKDKEVKNRKERRSLINFFGWLQERDFIDDSKYMVVPYEVVDTYLELNESLIVGQNPIKVTDDDGELIGVRFDKPDELDCPYDFTSRCTLGRCDCKPNNQ